MSRMRELLGDKQEVKEIPRSQRYPGRPPLDRLFVGNEKNRQQRNKWVVEAHITHGYTLKDIADCLGIHYTTVSKILKFPRNLAGENENTSCIGTILNKRTSNSMPIREGFTKNIL